MCNNVKWHKEKVLNTWREVQKGMESQDNSWNLSVIRKQSGPLSVQINISWSVPNDGL